MRRTSVVLALVAAMVMTVLVFAAPAFAEKTPIGPQPPDDTQVTPDTQLGVPPSVENTIGDLASGEALDATRHEGDDEGPEPPGYHILEATPFTPGELVQLCRDNPDYPLCT